MKVNTKLIILAMVAIILEIILSYFWKKAENFFNLHLLLMILILISHYILSSEIRTTPKQ